MVKCRGTAVIPKNQVAAIRIHDIKLSEGIMLSPGLLRFVTNFPDPASKPTKFQKLYKSHESLVEYLETKPLQSTSIRVM